MRSSKSQTDSEDCAAFSHEIFLWSVGSKRSANCVALFCAYEGQLTKSCHCVCARTSDVVSEVLGECPMRRLETDPDSEWQVADKQLSACILYRWVSSCRDGWAVMYMSVYVRLAVLHAGVSAMGRLTDLGARMRTCWVAVRVCVGAALGGAPVALAALAVP